VCDARTGQPLPQKTVRFYEHWNIYNQKNQRQDCFWDSSTVSTDTNGVVLYQRKHSDHGSQVDAVVDMALYLSSGQQKFFSGFSRFFFRHCAMD
jgi:hypothetical protein